MLIHVGFAMSKISEQDALDQMRILRMLGEAEQAMQEVSGYGLDDRAFMTNPMSRTIREGDMRFVDEFRDPEIITKTAEEIRRLADPGGIIV